MSNSQRIFKFNSIKIRILFFSITISAVFVFMIMYVYAFSNSIIEKYFDSTAKLIYATTISEEIKLCSEKLKYYQYSKNKDDLAIIQNKIKSIVNLGIMLQNDTPPQNSDGLKKVKDLNKIINFFQIRVLDACNIINEDIVNDELIEDLDEVKGLEQIAETASNDYIISEVQYSQMLQEGIKKDNRNLGMILILMIRIFIIIIIFFTISFYKKVIQPIKLVSKGLSTLAEEEDFNIEQELEFNSNVEINELFLAFNKILKKQKEQIVLLKKAQEILIEQEKLSSLEILAAGITHNLKTPIMSSAGGLSIIKRNTDKITECIQNEIDSKNQAIIRYISVINDWTQRIQDSLKYMDSMIAAVGFSTGKLMYEGKEYFTVGDIIDKVLSLIKFELKENKCLVNKEINIDCSEKIQGDINDLMQVLINISSNAIEAGKESAIIILGVSKKSDCILFYVKNFGDKISDQIKNSIFKKMVTTKGKHGKGIGLYISQTIIKARFNGKMYFESDEKETTFYVEIPIRKKEE